MSKKRKILVKYCPKCGREITNYTYAQDSSNEPTIYLKCGTCGWKGVTRPLDYVAPKTKKNVNWLGV